MRSSNIHAFWHIHIPRSALWAAFLSLALGFCGVKLGNHIHDSLEKQVIALQEQQAAYGGPHAQKLHAAASDTFPPFGFAIAPFGFSPDWGSMKSTAQFTRSFCEMKPADFTAPPAYDIQVLTTPLAKLNGQPRTPEVTRDITAKLFYSTRYLGKYDLDSAEYVATTHPALDIKMPKGTPVGAIAGGEVNAVGNDPQGLGIHVIIEHHLPQTGERVFSVYGHLQAAIVNAGDPIVPGQVIGIVGNTGDSTAPHLHLQIDRARTGELVHAVYVPGSSTTIAEATRMTIHPIDFLRQYGSMNH